MGIVSDESGDMLECRDFLVVVVMMMVMMMEMMMEMMKTMYRHTYTMYKCKINRFRRG